MFRVCARLAALLLGAILIVPGFAGAGTPAAAPVAPGVAVPAAGAQAGVAVPDEAARQAAESSQYKIGPGDGLTVFVFGNPELTSQLVVRPDGQISMPLVDQMIANGKTPSQLARDIEKVIGEYVRNPQVTVIVSQAISVTSQVKVVGQVSKPQSIPYREGMKVLDVILTVGGLTPFAAGNRARIVRMDNGHEEQIRVKLDRLVNKADMSQNLQLQPGDVLIVPESIF